MAGHILLSDTQSLESKHSGKYISSFLYDVGQIQSLISTGVLNIMKDTLHFNNTAVCNVLSKLEASTIFNDYDAIRLHFLQNHWVKEWGKQQHKVQYQLVISL